ncbi:Uncharacterized conserved protein, contains Mth938-like domain [Arboricoccus pini]|uniref:Uncharacterized conserved protein, contains Mth938-like domain n=1 Tax=Arboricoccus pini TaxID=1963835 RepID=A0A212QPY4_9PROT|nr:Mth938-like domain-containing protein [Arboricoccus pini]SNB61498.1 Uncharacterized conserved protein, contains Mth938-like domain [Arboricoccus pini]
MPSELAATSRPQGRLFIEGYGEGGFRIGGQRRQGSQIILPAAVQDWPVAALSGLALEAFVPLFEHAGALDILLLGCGTLPVLPDRALQAALKDKGLRLDMMTTPAACRTYNILLAEDRRVAAALIAVA